MSDLKSLLAQSHSTSDKVIQLIIDKISTLEIEGFKKDKKIKDLEKTVQNLAYNLQGFASEFSEVKSNVESDMQNVKLIEREMEKRVKSYINKV